MADRRPVETVAEAVALLADPECHAACDAAHIEHAERVRDTGAGLSVAEYRTFLSTWGVVPTWNDGLYRPAGREPGAALLAGRWGLIRIFPWTTDAEIRAAGRAIHAAIGKRHRDSVQHEQAGARVAWLRRCGFSDAEMSAGLGRTKDARRPTKEQANRGRLLTKQDKLVTRYYRDKGMPYRLALRLALAEVRGTEGRGARAARMSARRAETAHRERKAEVKAPRSVNPVTDAITELLHAQFVTFDRPRAVAAVNWLRAVLLDQPIPPAG